MSWGGSASSMNSSLKDNNRLKGKPASYFKTRKKDKTIYKKQTDKNLNKMSSEEFEKYKQNLKEEKDAKALQTIIIILVFAVVFLTPLVFLWLRYFS